MVKIKVNGKERTLDVDPEMPLLWVLREELEMTGTKFGCGIGACGACTVHLDGVPVRSCGLPVSAAAGRNVTTIEGLVGRIASSLQAAWVAENVAQCGYCQSGQIMTAAALIASNPHPSDKEIEAAMSGHICRCGTYQRIKNAIRATARNLASTHAAGGRSK
ncbi:isoquinoline 1-oxidoreductase [Denitratisoma sp. DHT3]|uniref:(2Fe-2S)-binding protein n=1 Tax=Denitratisoma sp. DHT3 TaxID=1981880 RepID=UPI001198A9EF|nr:(2Fe-2S)-binding protein [Denitratisoma sp. DHT3]QDX80251.1 isoquinoline 1-oxidoreductase [Denitratisoma sp. DHT3]